MKTVRSFFRLLQIQCVLARWQLDRWFFSVKIWGFLRLIIRATPWCFRVEHPLSRGEALRCALQDLGPIYVKFGQALSTRGDLLPMDVVLELAKLQDNVPPFSGELAKTMVEENYGKPITELFEHFDRKPLASASIAQVHAATLPGGEKVVVKILRPNIKKNIARDTRLLETLARGLLNCFPPAERFKPIEVVDEFTKTLIYEINLMTEAANAAMLERNAVDTACLKIPKIYWPYATRNMLVMERIYGIPVTNIKQLREQGINMKKLAERGVEIFFKQVFRDRFFHADMHPGNIFVDYENPDDPQYIAVDFGIVGRLNERDQRYLAENFLAFFNRDYYRVAELHVESGWLPPETRIDEFETAIRTVCEPIFGKPLREISIAQMLVNLFKTGRRFRMRMQPQLILLQKTLFSLEGLGRQLYPELDLWSTAKPFLEKWLREQMSMKTLLKKCRHQLPFWLDKAPELPVLAYEALLAIKQQRQPSDIALDAHLKANSTKKRSCLRSLSALLSATFLGGGLLVHFEKTDLSFGFMSIGLLFLLLTLFFSRR